MPPLRADKNRMKRMGNPRIGIGIRVPYFILNNTSEKTVIPEFGDDIISKKTVNLGFERSHICTNMVNHGSEIVHICTDMDDLGSFLGIICNSMNHLLFTIVIINKLNNINYIIKLAKYCLIKVCLYYKI